MSNEVLTRKEIGANGGFNDPSSDFRQKTLASVLERVQALLCCSLVLTPPGTRSFFTPVKQFTCWSYAFKNSAQYCRSHRGTLVIRQTCRRKAKLQNAFVYKLSGLTRMKTSSLLTWVALLEVTRYTMHADR